MINLPIPLKDYSHALTRFRSSLEHSRIPVRSRKVFYQQLGISASWKGEVLLLQFNNDRAREIRGQTMSMTPYVLGNSGLSIQSPGPFTVEREVQSPARQGSVQTLQQGSYAYRQHGVSVTVSYRRMGSSTRSLLQWRRQLEGRLHNVQGLRLRDISVDALKKDKARGFQYRVHYEMAPFGKSFIYRIQALQGAHDSWVINASYKDCDPRGKAIVNAMLDSVVLPTLR
jgi:hypothetical protein